MFPEKLNVQEIYFNFSEGELSLPLCSEMDVLKFWGLKYYFQWNNEHCLHGAWFPEVIDSTFLGNYFLPDDFVGDSFSGRVSSESASLEGCREMKNVRNCCWNVKKLKLGSFTDKDALPDIPCPNLGSLETIQFKAGRLYGFNFQGLVRFHFSKYES